VGEFIQGLPVARGKAKGDSTKSRVDLPGYRTSPLNMACTEGGKARVEKGPIVFNGMVLRIKERRVNVSIKLGRGKKTKKYQYVRGGGGILAHKIKGRNPHDRDQQDPLKT